MKKVLAFFLALLMCLSLAACQDQTDPTTGTQKEATPAPTKKEEPSKAAENPTSEPETPAATASETEFLKLGLSLNETLSAWMPSFTQGHQFQYALVFSSLIEFDTDTREYVNCLAKDLKISDDGKLYTVTLGDHKFHDGSPVTADDVVFTFTMAVRANSSRATGLSLVEGYDKLKSGETETFSGIKKIDDKTVSFTLTKADSLFRNALATRYHAILPAKYFEGMTPTEVKENVEFWKAPIGAGPYMVTETNYPSYATLTRFDDYYQPAGIKNVLLTYYTDAAASDAAWAADELYYGTNATIEKAKEFMALNTNVTYELIPSLYTRFFRVNWSGSAGDGESHPSLKNAKIRHALDMLIDKEAVAIHYGEEVSNPLTTRIDSNTPEFNSDIPLWKQDLKGAKKILDEEGFRYDIPIRVYCHYVDQGTTDLLEMIKQNFAEVGIEMTYVQDKNHQPIAAVTDWDLRLEAASITTPLDCYSKLLTTFQPNPAANCLPIAAEGFVDYWKPRYDDLYNEWKATTDPVKQKSILDKIQYNAYEDMPEIPLISLNVVNLYHAKFQGIPIYPRDYEEMVALKTYNWYLVD